MKKQLWWKFLLPAGAVIYFLFYGSALGILGFVLIAVGVIDFFRQQRLKRSGAPKQWDPENT